MATRGENVDITFSDGKHLPLSVTNLANIHVLTADNGPWTFKNGAREVGAIVCNPAFVARTQ